MATGHARDVQVLRVGEHAAPSVPRPPGPRVQDLRQEPQLPRKGQTPSWNFGSVP